MRRRSAAESLWLAGWAFLLAGTVEGCNPPGQRAFGQDEQDDAAPTPDPLPGVARVSDATPDQLKAACRGLSVEKPGNPGVPRGQRVRDDRGGQGEPQDHGGGSEQGSDDRDGSWPTAARESGATASNPATPRAP